MTVKELRELLARATKGPWWVARRGRYGWHVRHRAGYGDEQSVADCLDSPKESEANAAAIVALRNSADAMLDVVEAAKAHLDVIRGTMAAQGPSGMALARAVAKLEGVG